MFCPENTEKCDVLRRYSQRMDGFVSVHADEDERLLVTKPFVFEGNTLYANMATTSAGYMYFTISDRAGNSVSSCEMFGDSTYKKIGFDKDLSDFSGKEVVLTVRMCDGDLYSIEFR